MIFYVGPDDFTWRPDDFTWDMASRGPCTRTILRWILILDGSARLKSALPTLDEKAWRPEVASTNMSLQGFIPFLSLSLSFFFLSLFMFFHTRMHGPSGPETFFLRVYLPDYAFRVASCRVAGRIQFCFYGFMILPGASRLICLLVFF